MNSATGPPRQIGKSWAWWRTGLRKSSPKRNSDAEAKLSKSGRKRPKRANALAHARTPDAQKGANRVERWSCGVLVGRLHEIIDANKTVRCFNDFLSDFERRHLTPFLNLAQKAFADADTMPELIEREVGGSAILSERVFHASNSCLLRNFRQAKSFLAG